MTSISIDLLEVGLYCTPQQPSLKEVIDKVDLDMSYDDFFHKYLLANVPCVVKNVTTDWPASKIWVKDNSINLDYFRETYRDVEVPISDCSKRVYNAQEKFNMKLLDYVSYLENYSESGQCESKPCFYLKDWHFTKQFPCENMYRVPKYFASDWINEYYTRNASKLNDDYRFVYLGPKGSWTPLHADVFTSFSWSVNVCGRKRWLLLPPGDEEFLKDKLGNLVYDLDDSIVNQKTSEGGIRMYEIIQEAGEAIFVPSGWHHQENTLSVNHNWINGCNISHMWTSLKKNLSDVKKEIDDCILMEDWNLQCQIVLRASYGIDYPQFYDFLVEIGKSRICCLTNSKPLKVYGDWRLGVKHLLFDLGQIIKVLKLFVEDPDVVDLGMSIFSETALEHPKEFLCTLEKHLLDCSLDQ